MAFIDEKVLIKKVATFFAIRACFSNFVAMERFVIRLGLRVTTGSALHCRKGGRMDYLQPCPLRLDAKGVCVRQLGELCVVI